MYDRRFLEMIKKYANNVDIKMSAFSACDLSMHSTHCINHGLDLRVVQMRLRHVIYNDQNLYA